MTRTFPPVFLVGPERAGTTLLRLMLDRHPQIGFHGELNYFVEHLPDSGPLLSTEEYLRTLRLDRAARRDAFSTDSSQDYVSVVRSMFDQVRAQAGTPVVGATVHHRFDRLPEIFPEAKFLHMRRDPRDVARSCIPMGWAGNVYVGVERWLRADERWSRLQACTARESRLELRYEDLVSAPEVQLSRICAWLGVAFDPEMLEYQRDSTYDAPDPSLAFQWKRKLSPYEVRLVELRCGERLARAGYEPSGFARLSPNALRHEWLRATSRLAVTRWRIARYGAGLWIKSALTRRVGMRSAFEASLLRTQEIDAAHLK